MDDFFDEGQVAIDADHDEQVADEAGEEYVPVRLNAHRSKK